MITTNNTLSPALSVPPDNIITIDFKKKRTTSLYKTDGVPKATAADPIRDPKDIAAMQDYFLSRGQVRDYTIFTLGIIFGIRAGDLLNLRIHHIMNDNGTFKLHCDLIESKTRKFNNPAITPQVKELLTNYLDTLPGYGMNDPLFRSQKRDKYGNLRPITLIQLNRILKTASTACNVPGHISSHSLRKTFAYHLLRSNQGDDKAKMALQQMLNHNDFKTTLIYSGLAQDAMDDYRERLAGDLFNV